MSTQSSRPQAMRHLMAERPRTAQVLVAKPGDRAYIPTLGYPTTALDWFRVVEFVKTGHEGWNSCFVDAQTCAGLARLIEGEVQEWSTIEAAELALQALLWHERIDVLVPAFKLRRPSGFVGYARCDPERSRLAFDLFQCCAPYDYLYCVEEVVAEDVIQSSSLQDSALVGRPVGYRDYEYLRGTPAQIAAFAALPPGTGVPAYFSDPVLPPVDANRAFFGSFYDAVRAPWVDAGDAMPTLAESVRLPPLLAIVLDRAASRERIPEAIAELREDLDGVRSQMLQLAEQLEAFRERSIGEREIESFCRPVQASFDAAFKASRYEARLRPLLRLYGALRSPLDWVISRLNPDYESPDPRRIANRTLAGRMFSRLLDTDSMHSLLRHFLTESEIRTLAATKPPRT